MTTSPPLAKCEPPSDEQILDGVRGHLQFVTSQLGDLPRGARVLDFGCGIGASVAALLKLGYDAYGVDILALWAEDHGQYWHDTEPPPPEVCARLHAVDTQNYRLPFADNTFDFCFSDQVLEHVFNYEAVFSELARVLRPGAISVHRFPGPLSPTEAHIEVAIIPLCRYKPWLALWALAGKRSIRQRGFSWKETLHSDIEMMKQCNYPTRKTLHRIAGSVGVRIAFMAEEGIRYTNVGRASGIVRCAARFHMERLALSLLSMISQRYMVIYGT